MIKKLDEIIIIKDYGKKFNVIARIYLLIFHSLRSFQTDLKGRSAMTLIVLI